VLPYNISKIIKMKSVKLKKFIPVAICLFALVSTTSCNRGLGCPGEISISKTVVKAAKVTIPTLAKKILK
jgi:hypothetical protein